MLGLGTQESPQQQLADLQGNFALPLLENAANRLQLSNISNSSVRFAIHYNLQDMYMVTRPPFVLQGMVAIPSFIILDFCVCNFNLVLSDFSSAELWLSVDTHHDTRIGAEVSAILTFMHAIIAIENVWEMFAHSAKYIAIRREIPN